MRPKKELTEEMEVDAELKKRKLTERRNGRSHSIQGQRETS